MTDRERYEDLYAECPRTVAPRENKAVREIGLTKSGVPQGQIREATRLRRAQIVAFLVHHPDSDAGTIEDGCGIAYDTVAQDCNRMAENNEIRKEVYTDKGARRRVRYWPIETEKETSDEQ